MWIASNHRPTISGTDKGIWRRIRLVPFKAEIPEQKKIKDLDKIIIREELPGILNRALRGCLAWQKAGTLFTPKSVLLATEEYRKDMDIIGQFIDECCDVGTGYSVLKADLYEAYRSWTLNSGHKYPLSSGLFGTKMKERNLFGEKKQRSMNGKYSWEGIQLKEINEFLQ
ncbi:MAG: phage polymerase [Firmicutes bacterium]|nr:phage polymerase [Bacillota bacterium]